MPLLNIFPAALHVNEVYFAKAKAMDVPTQKRKNGKTRSHGVQPSQAACLRGGKILDQEPGLLTMIMKATVRPLSTSREIYLLVISVVNLRAIPVIAEI